MLGGYEPRLPALPALLPAHGAAPRLRLPPVPADEDSRALLCYLFRIVFHSRDPENEEHRTWSHPFDPTLTSTESFPELREKARQFAVRLITAAYRYVVYGEGTEESLEALIGDRSYLSGLPSEDPRNLAVPSMLPPGAEAEKEKP